MTVVALLVGVMESGRDSGHFGRDHFAWRGDRR